MKIDAVLAKKYHFIYIMSSYITPKFQSSRLIYILLAEFEPFKNDRLYKAKKLKYRSEINGLRALAIIPVILFHAGFTLFSGGFIGVDVFFVISGYLITTILIEALENNNFSIIHFYERRARRILPVLFFIMFICIIFSWVWMQPDQLKSFFQSVFAVSFFASNILFWKQSGYFDSSSEEKPLLHTWSLAVEEQYYLLLPIFLFFAWRLGKDRVFYLIILFTALSLIMSEWGWRNNPTANFYLAPTRAWELFSGSIAAFIVRKNGVKNSNLLSFLGLAMIIFSIFTYDETTPFPSVYALVPVIGSVLLIIFAHSNTIAAKILSTKIFVAIGLISYSAYLWHQPLFAFARIYSIESPSLTVMAGLSIFSMFLAYLSWKFIEAPFRNQKFLSTKVIFSMSLTVIISFSILGLAGHKEIIKSFSYIKNQSVITSLGDTKYGGDGYKWIELLAEPEVVLVGDSHAKQYIKAMRQSLGTVSLIAESACLSLPNIINEYQGQNLSRYKCIGLYQKYINYLKDNPSIDTVFFTQRWGKNLYDIKQNKLLGKATESDLALVALEDNLRQLFGMLELLNRRIIVIGNVPSAYVADSKLQKGYVNCIYKFGTKNCPISYDQNKKEGQWINTILKRLTNEFKNINFIDPADALCDSEQCFIVLNGKLLYSDHAHLTNEGARLVIDAYLSKIDKQIIEIKN